VCGKKWKGETVAEQLARMASEEKIEKRSQEARNSGAGALIRGEVRATVRPLSSPPGSYSYKTGLGLTPPPGLRDSLPPPPDPRSRVLDSPEVIASRGAGVSTAPAAPKLSDELKSATESEGEK
jgi:hypothetical protein